MQNIKNMYYTHLNVTIKLGYWETWWNAGGGGGNWWWTSMGSCNIPNHFIFFLFFIFFINNLLTVTYNIYLTYTTLHYTIKQNTTYLIQYSTYTIGNTLYLTTLCYGNWDKLWSCSVGHLVAMQTSPLVYKFFWFEPVLWLPLGP